MRTPSVSTGVMAGVLLLATAAGAQPIRQANPYASRIAQASPLYGSFMTIDDLRAYMAEHPDCQNGGNSPSQIKPPVPLPPRTSSGLTYNDVPAMVAAYKQNEVRFKRDYVGRQFSDRLRLERVSNGNGITSDTRTAPAATDMPPPTRSATLPAARQRPRPDAENFGGEVSS